MFYMNAEERTAALRARLGPAPRFGGEIVWPDETASTNDLCHAAGRPGFVALAERQTAGRGTHGRSWEAPAGKSVLLSAVAPAADFADDAFLSALAAVGVEGALAEQCRIAAWIKWPNDLLANGKKIAGALVERRNGVAVLGVGINVLQTKSDLPPDPRWPATSAQLQWPEAPIDRMRIAGELLRVWDRCWRSAEESGPELLHDRWQRHAWPRIDTPVIVTRIDGAAVAGELVSMRLDAGVTLRTASGEHQVPAAFVAGVLPADWPCLPSPARCASK